LLLCWLIDPLCPTSSRTQGQKGEKG
jgi:hypothetical protein